VNGSGYTHHEAALFFSEIAFLPDAVRFFADRFALPILAVIATGSALTWLAARRGPQLRSWAWLAVPIAAFAASDHLIDRTSGKVYQFAAPIRVPLLTAWAWEHRLPHYAEREPPRFAPSEPPLADHIVLVVDESVNGHSLGINGGPAGTTPWLASRPEGVFNYGIASAISNLSSSSNLLLQTGLPLSAFPDRDFRALRVANVFAYLAAAGYRTAFINAQTYSDQPPNLMTGFDFAHIDTVLRLRETHRGAPESEFDLFALPELRAQIEASPKSFVYLLKTARTCPTPTKSPVDRQPSSPLLDSWAFSGDPTRDPQLVLERCALDRRRLPARSLARARSDRTRGARDLHLGPRAVAARGPGTVARKVTPHATAIDPPPQQGFGSA
jgi:lipid A ethanolaminephosphotransferase